MIKANCFTTHCIDKWRGLEIFNRDGFIFRGQRNSNWTFESSLQRLCNNMDIDLKYAYIIERELSSEFKRRFHQYSNSQPNYLDNLGWLSEMRHHMAPTRLLDWTYSIFVATYFALEQPAAKEGAAVWALNVKWARIESKKEWLIKGKEQKHLGHPDEPLKPIRSPIPFKELFLTDPFSNVVCPITPDRLTQRLTAQKGLFLCAGNPNITFDENIESMDGFKEKDNIIRLIIPTERRKEYLKRLNSMNITRTTLFPGLDGFSSSLSVYHHCFDEKELENSSHKEDDRVWGPENDF